MMKITKNYNKSYNLLQINCLLKYNSRNLSELKSYLSVFREKHPQKECEKFWSDFWHKNELFSSKQRKPTKHFSLLLPPPNITGSLHLGHALTLSIEDAICRYHRMNGYSVEWIPGLDHAGIATQMMVEKMLWTKHHKTRHDLSREQFISEVNEWKNLRSREIREQLMKLGVCLDFDKEFFTLSETMSESVNEAFVRLFNSGQIYRKSLAVNWSFYLQSTISDIEVDYHQISGPTLLTVPGFDDKVLVGVMHRFNYPIEGSDNVISVATTRLETILGDVGVAVHPEDERYSQLIGRNAINPLNGRKMPIISDTSVRPDFGTGAVKLTPGHSSFDYLIAEKNSLPIYEIFDDSGRLYCPDLPQFHRMHRFSAKDVMRDYLMSKGLYLDQTDHKHSIPLCSRSGDIIESRRVPQWYLKCDVARVLSQFVVNRDYMSETDEQKWNTLKELLKEEDKHLSLIPPNNRIVWNEWFSHYEDWCISRQIYWGHRIPAYNVIIDNEVTDEWVSAKSESEALSIARNKFPTSAVTVKQDNDVLDTWFSSALLPLSIAGWPQKTPLKPFPLSLMETGFDILFFWVARMVLISLSLEGKLPFNRVLLHGMVCDADGKKMSKSKGNVIDPNDIIDGISLKDMKRKNIEYFESGVLSKNQLDLSLKAIHKKFPNGVIDCGADALRLYLLEQDFKEEKICFDVQSMVKNRNFCNKMHQSVKFFVTNFDHRFQLMDILTLDQYLTPTDRWILSRLVEVIKNCNKMFASYDLQYAAQGLKHFWVNQMCDIYIEHIKPIVYGDCNESRNCVLNVLLTCLLTSLRAIHPFMPFITENLYQHLMQRLNPERDENTFRSICDESYPDLSTDQFMTRFDFGLNDEMRAVEAVIQKIRWFKQYFEVKNNFIRNDVLIAINGNYLESYRTLITNASKVNSIKFVSLHEINKYDKYFCFKIQTKEWEESKESKPHSSDCYVLFDVDYESLFRSMSESGVKTEDIEIKSQELQSFECKHFHRNYWKTKSLRELN